MPGGVGGGGGVCDTVVWGRFGGGCGTVVWGRLGGVKKPGLAQFLVLEVEVQSRSVLRCAALCLSSWWRQAGGPGLGGEPPGTKGGISRLGEANGR